jgi:hypothetical protein
MHWRIDIKGLQMVILILITECHPNSRSIQFDHQFFEPLLLPFSTIVEIFEFSMNKSEDRISIEPPPAFRAFVVISLSFEILVFPLALIETKPASPTFPSILLSELIDDLSFKTKFSVLITTFPAFPFPLEDVLI